MEVVSQSFCDPKYNFLHFLTASEPPVNCTVHPDHLEFHQRTAVEYYVAVFVLVVLFAGTLVTNGIVLTALLFCNKRRLIQDSPLDVLILSMTVADLFLLVPIGFSLYDVAQDQTAAPEECLCLFLCCWDYGLQTVTVLHLLAVNAQRYKGIQDSFYSPGNPTSRRQAGAGLVAIWLIGTSVFISLLNILDTAEYSYWDLTCIVAMDTYTCRLEVITSIFLAMSAASVITILMLTVALMCTVLRLRTLPRPALGPLDDSASQNVEMEEMLPADGSQPQPGPSRNQRGERRGGRRTNTAMRAMLASLCPCQTRSTGDKETQTYDDVSTIQSHPEESTVKLWILLTSIAIVAVVCYVPQVFLNLGRWLRSDFRPHPYFVFASRILFYLVGVINPVQNALHRKQVINSVFKCNCRACHLLLRMCNTFRESEHS